MNKTLNRIIVKKCDRLTWYEALLTSSASEDLRSENCHKTSHFRFTLLIGMITIHVIPFHHRYTHNTTFILLKILNQIWTHLNFYFQSLCPFPADEIQHELAKYSKAKG